VIGASHFHPPGWLEAVSWFMLATAFASALVILYDIVVRGHRQKMAIMNAVYPITALYWGPLAPWFYFRFGDSASGDRFPTLSKAVSHCGAGCTLGDIAGEWLVHTVGLTFFFAGVAGSLMADFTFDFVFAWSLGVLFQYFTIVPMRDNLGPVKGIWAAVKADTFSIVAFQAGLFAAMALYQLVIFSPGLPKTTATYWFMMQLAMILGFFTALPANAWLISKGWKEAM